MDRHNYSGRGYADDWNKTSYSEGGGSNHVHRPVIVDAEGRKKPFLPFAPNSETYFKVSAERTVERVRAPVVVAEYKYSSEGIVEPYGYGKSYGEYGFGSPTKVEPPKRSGEYGYNFPTKVEPVKSPGEYGYGSPPKRDPTRNYGALGSGPNDKWGGYASPIGSHPPATEYGHGYPTSKEGYIKDSGVARDTGKWGPQVSTTDYGYGYPVPVKDSRVANDKRERPQPTRPNIVGAPAWPRPSGPGDTTGYEDYNTSRDRNKPGGRSDYYQKNDKFSDPIAPFTGSNRERPGQRLNYGTPLSGPTNDIEKAVEMLKEAVKSTDISTMIPVVPRKEPGYGNAIDSKEAAKRYGNFNLQQRQRPYQPEGTTYIDSTEAARKYGGAAIPKYNP
ncbi:hypothetical protein NMG60_11009710 [Bertholletia excelsa]